MGPLSNIFCVSFMCVQVHGHMMKFDNRAFEYNICYPMDLIWYMSNAENH